MVEINVSTDAVEEISNLLQKVNGILSSVIDETQESPLRDYHKIEVDAKLDAIQKFISEALGMVGSIQSRLKSMYVAINAYADGSGASTSSSTGGRSNNPSFGSGVSVKRLDNGNILVGNIDRDANHAIINQGSNPKIKGTCGLCSSGSALNSLGLALTEQDMIDHAVNHEPRLCSESSNPAKSGGTSTRNRTDLINSILEENGMQNYCTDADPTVDSVASELRQGNRVIASVNADSFYGNPDYAGFRHAVYVSAAEFSPAGEVVGFRVIDSNGTNSTNCVRTMSTREFAACLSPSRINVIR